MLIIATATMAAISISTYLMLFKGEYPSIAPIILPFTDLDNSTVGYYLNLINQIAICEVGIFTNIGCECMSVFLVNNVMVAVETIRFDLKKFNNLLSSDKVSYLEKKIKLRNILIQMQDVDR